MKKLIIIVLGMLFTMGVVNAQDVKKAEPAKAKTTKSATKEKCNLKNCCMMVDGKMVMMKDGKEMPMTEDVTLANGDKVSKEGTITTKDGKVSKMKNNDCIDMNGVWGKGAKPKTPAKK